MYVNSSFFKKKFIFIYLFTYGCAGSSLLPSGFLQLQQVEATLQLQCPGFSLGWLLLLWRTKRQSTSSVVVAHRLSCPAACGIFPDQVLNPWPLHWQEESLPLCHPGNCEDISLSYNHSVGQAWMVSSEGSRIHSLVHVAVGTIQVQGLLDRGHQCLVPYWASLSIVE